MREQHFAHVVDELLHGAIHLAAPENERLRRAVRRRCIRGVGLVRASLGKTRGRGNEWKLREIARTRSARVEDMNTLFFAGHPGTASQRGWARVGKQLQE